jgi:hypothetical protein
MIMTGKPHHHPFESTAIQKGKKKEEERTQNKEKKRQPFFLQYIRQANNIQSSMKQINVKFMFFLT